MGLDHFDKIQKLPDPIPGCPNFRRVPGFKVYCCGQPTLKEKFPGLVHWRVPVCNSAAPLEIDFDIMVNTLVGTSINTPVIINDQVGLSRATSACVAACLFKEFQISASYEGLIETVPGLNATVLKTDKYVMDQTKDALFRGEFEVVKELVAKMKDGVAAKNNADKNIDTGKGNLQWERDIPPAALSNLEGLAAKDFKGNLGQ